MCFATPAAELLLPTSTVAASAARDWARLTYCREHHLAVLDDALLLISELVTNAVLHGGPPILLAVECDEQVLRVRVRDGSSTVPVPRPARAEEENGRGMSLVDLIADTWGVTPVADEHGPGKHVWFELR